MTIALKNVSNILLNLVRSDFPSTPANTGNTGLVPGLGRFHGPWGDYARVLQLLSLHSGPVCLNC